MPTTQFAHYLQRILTAKVYDVAKVTPLEAAQHLSKRLHNTVLFKREDLQPVFSFKLRGAYNKMANLSAAELAKGVICASAGNHAQGVALGAQRLGTSAVVVMPVTTPAVKVEAVKNLNATVLLHGDSYSDAYTAALKVAEQQGRVFVHPFDDPDVIAGQGTIAMELLQQVQALGRDTRAKPKGEGADRLDAVFVAIGGGGLISGIAAYIKMVRPGVKVIGVQMTDSDAMKRSVEAGKRVTLETVGIFADGTAVKQVGEETFRIARALVDDYVVVSTDEVCAAVKDVFAETRCVVEPSGAMSVAAIKQYCAQHKTKGETYAAILCGANMNFDRLRFVAERAEVGEQRESLLGVTIPEERGSFRRFCEAIGNLPGGPHNVTEFNYRISDSDCAHVFVGLSTHMGADSKRMVRALGKAGFDALDLTQNELAKSHVRHLVGGRSPLAQDERLLRFEFPERPGALLRFLSEMQPSWNISLFHYRNQGADYGRILVGMQVPPKDKAAFKKFLKSLGYSFVDETDNLAYRMFLN